MLMKMRDDNKRLTLADNQRDRSSPAAVGISPVIESGVAISPSDTKVALGAICKVSLMKVVVSNKSVVMSLKALPIG